MTNNSNSRTVRALNSWYCWLSSNTEQAEHQKFWIGRTVRSGPGPLDPASIRPKLTSDKLFIFQNSLLWVHDKIIVRQILNHSRTGPADWRVGLWQFLLENLDKTEHISRIDFLLKLVFHKLSILDSRRSILNQIRLVLSIWIFLDLLLILEGHYRKNSQ